MPHNPRTADQIGRWRTLQIQLIAFPQNPEQLGNQNWWEEIIGGEYESSRKKLERIDSGEVDGHLLRLSIDPLRVVWTAAAKLDPEALDAPPSIGSITDSIRWLSDITDIWLSNGCPPLTRLAFVAKLLRNTESRDEAYLQLSNYLHGRVVIEADASSEFQYRINRPIQSNVLGNDIKLNRLQTWSAVKMQFQVLMGIPGTSLTRDIPREFHGCVLDLDINTPQDFNGVLEKERILEIWNELVSLGLDIAKNGDAV